MNILDPMTSMRHQFFCSILNCGLLCLSILHGAIAQSCSKDLYGTPNIQDCYEAMFWIPYINPPGRYSPDAQAFRIFAEPQFQSPPFGAVQNPYAPKAIVQLPKIWKHGALPRIHSTGGRNLQELCQISPYSEGALKSSRDE